MDSEKLIPVTYDEEVIGHTDGNGAITFLSDELRDKVMRAKVVGVSSRKLEDNSMENFDLEKFKDFVNTYDSQPGHKSYSTETVINDFLYGIGICIEDSVGEDFKWADGFKRFKDFLLNHLKAVPNNSLPKKCYCGNPVDESNSDCVEFNLCRDHKMDA